MHAEDLLIDDSGEREDIENILKLAPQLDAVSPLACDDGHSAQLKKPSRSRPSKTRAEAAGQQRARLGAGGKEQQQAEQRTLVIEAIDAIDRGALVVAAQQEKVFGVFDLVRQ